MDQIPLSANNEKRSKFRFDHSWDWVQNTINLTRVTVNF